MSVICLLVAILGQSPSSDCDALVAKLEQTDPGDPAALLEFGRTCEQRRCLTLAAVAYRRILRLETSASNRQPACEASFRLARILLKKGKPDYEQAFTLLRRAVLDCPEHEQARKLLQSAENSQTRKQVSLVEEANKLYEQGEKEREKASVKKALAQYRKALTRYEEAFKLSPEEATGSAFVPRSTILGKLAECRDCIDDQLYRNEFLPRERSVRPCSLCTKELPKGFLTCGTCAGQKGKWVMVRIGKQMVRRWQPCQTCHGHGYQGCGQCFGLGYSSPQITDEEKKALKTVALSAAHPKLFRARFDVAAETVGKLLQSVKEGAALNYLRAMKSDYSNSRGIRDGVERLPAALGSVSDASTAWEQAAADNRVKVNFLLNYACEYADYIGSFDMLRGSKSPDTRALCSESSWAGETLTPELLSAFPDERALGCVAVEGVLEGYRPGKTSEHKGYLEIRGGIPHTVRFFVWLPSAEEHIRQLQQGPWKRSLRTLESGYPFAIGNDLSAVPEDHRIVVVGRFLRDRMGYPRNWFEVWRYEIGLGAAQQEIFERLAGPVDMTFSSLTMRQVARILGDWFDVAVQLDGVSGETFVSCEATSCPMGLMVDAIVRSALGADWYFSGGRVVVCPRGESPRSPGMKVVLEKLQQTKQSDARVVASRANDGRPSDLPVPDDPAGLRVVLRGAARKMDYRLACECLQMLHGSTSAVEQKDLVEQLQAKMGLFARLCGRTPVSHLVHAPELCEVVYRKRSGDTVKRTVTLERRGDTYQVQEAYGARFSIRPELVTSVTPVSALEWRKTRQQAFEASKKSLADAPPQERAGKLYFLALYAKTHDYSGEGDRLLNQALDLHEFEEFLSRFFGDDSSELTTLCRRAKGRTQEREDSSISVTELAAPEQTVESSPPPTATVTPLPDGLTEAELFTRARAYAKAGSVCTRRVLEGEHASEWKKLAIENFLQAEGALKRLMEMRPGDSGVKRLWSDVFQRRTSCQKDLGFFDA